MLRGGGVEQSIEPVESVRVTGNAGIFYRLTRTDEADDRLDGADGGSYGADDGSYEADG
jgi:hypothetical protein